MTGVTSPQAAWGVSEDVWKDLGKKYPAQSGRKKQFARELASERSQRESSSRDACRMEEAEAKAEAKRAEAKAREKAEKKINRMRKEIESFNEPGKSDTLPTARRTRLGKRNV